MVSTLSTVITNETTLVELWKHECIRVFADRFTILSDKEWFSTELVSLVLSELGEDYVDMVKANPGMVFFLLLRIRSFR